MCLHYKLLENTAGKGEIALNEQFLLFLQCFLPFFENFLPFSSHLKLSSAESFSFLPFFENFRELSSIFITFEIVVCRVFRKSLKFVVWERAKCILFHTAFNITSVISRWQLTFSCTCISPRFRQY